MQCFFPKSSFLEFGDREVSQSIRALCLSQRPIQSAKGGTEKKVFDALEWLAAKRSFFVGFLPV
jgi:hypothetical protein